MLDCTFLLIIESVVLEGLGLLTNPVPVGDDPLVHVQKIIDLSRNFLHFQWDPRFFNGYSPSTGFAWASYAPPALLVSLGLDPLIVFHATFVAYFLAFGLSIYYFARSVGASRIVALAVSVPGWSTVGFLGYISGGAYSRTFTLPFIFVALALTYRHAKLQNTGRLDWKTYGFLLLAWFIAFLGDVYMSVVPVIVAIPCVLLSAGWRNIRSNVIRLAVISLPVLALTSWFWIPLATHVLSVGSPPSELIPSIASQLFWAGPALSIVAVVIRKRSASRPLGPEHSAILFSLNLVSVYFLIMGAITPFWPYLPRVWAAYDSFNILSFLFPMTAACIYVWLKPQRRGMTPRYKALLLIILVVANGVPVIYLFRPPDRNPFNNSLLQAFTGNLVTSPDYRISLQGRVLTRFFPYYYSDALQTGGRVSGLDQSPFYQSWYETDVFYKNDLSKINSVYIEDQPPINVTNLIGAPQNYASTMFWLDWYGVGTLVLNPGFYPVEHTAENFSLRGALFSTKIVQTSYGDLVFVNPTDTSPTLIATNASTIGFYSQKEDSLVQYHDILALLSYLGLDSRYIVPINLLSIDNIDAQWFSTIITDEYTYSRATNKLNALEGQGVKVIVVSADYFSKLQPQGPTGAMDFVKLVSPVFSAQIQNLTRLSSFPSQTLTIDPSSWSQGFAENSQGSLQTSQGNLTVKISIPDIAKTAEFGLDVSLPNPVVLGGQLEPHLEIKSDVRSTVRLGFTSGNFTGILVSSSAVIDPDRWTSLQIPFANFTSWTNPQSKFATATGFSVEVIIPPGHPNATVQLASASLSEPGYVVDRLPKAVSLSAVGFLQGPVATGIVLSDESGNLEGTYSRFSSQSMKITAPIAAFQTQANNNFTSVLFVNPESNQESTFVLFPEPSWVPVENRWITNEAMNAQVVQTGFRGLVWKETFTNNWNIMGTDQANHELSLSSLPAGPGLVYIPLGGAYMATLNFSYRNSVYTLFLPLFSGLSVVPLIALRRRISLMGTAASR